MPKKTVQRRKRRSKGGSIKQNVIFILFSIMSFLGGGLIALSFFQSSPALDSLRLTILEKFGWEGTLLPVILFSFSLLFLRLKIAIARPHISFGLLLFYVCLLGLTHNGTIGNEIWVTFSSLISNAGATLVLIFMMLIGLIVLFNMSLEELTGLISFLVSGTVNLFKPIFERKSSPAFLQKLPIKTPADFKADFKMNGKTDFKTNERKEEPKIEEKPPMKIKSPPPQQMTSANGTLGTTVLTNTPTSNTTWEYPPLSLLTASNGQKADRGDLKHNAHTIEKTLESFGIAARVAEVNLGPAVTQYALEIALGTKVSKITSLSNDLALALAAPTGQIRIEAPIPGRSLVGIEIPNRSLEFVTLRHMLASDIMKRNPHKMLVSMGLDVGGVPVIGNISKMPHVLIAGTTGSGKSVLVNTWICSLLMRTTPAETRLILVDPKRVELTGYNGVPHLLTPVIVEPDKILSALRWATQEMDRRYKLFAEVGVRNIDGYNELSGFQAVPYIVIFIDELADLMAYAPVEVEDNICRLAQMSRAVGIHLVLATQRPSVDVITGLIKANVPTRIAFNVSAMTDSRVILDAPGAEKLLGRGDMLYIPPDQAKPTRIQGSFVTEHEISRVVDFLKSKNAPVEYTQEVTSMTVTTSNGKKGASGSAADDGKDDMFEQAVRCVCQYDRASASLLQRRLSVGYARAARIIDQLEEAGVIGSGDGAKPRDVLIKNPDEFFAARAEGTTPPSS